jgi:hypothetical protein
VLFSGNLVSLPTPDWSYLVVRGSGEGVFYRIHDSATEFWSPWHQLPGATCDSPASAIIGNGLHVVVRGANDDQIWHGYINLETDTFSSLALIGGSTPSAPTLTANSTHPCLVMRGQNNLIYCRFYDCTAHTWAGWIALPSGSTCDSPAATVLGNKLHVVVRGMDGHTLWHSSVGLSAGAFSEWALIGGATESKPTLAACESRNEIVLVVRGLNDVIYRNTWSDSGWAGWVGLPSGSTCDGIGAAVIGETLHVVVRGMDGYTLWHANVDLTTSTFAGWTLLSGSTPSKPTLAG